MPDNLSDHNPISIVINVVHDYISKPITCIQHDNKGSSSNIVYQPSLRRDHAKLDDDYDCTRSLLQPIYDELTSDYYHCILSHSYCCNSVDLDCNSNSRLHHKVQCNESTCHCCCTLNDCTDLGHNKHCEYNYESIVKRIESIYSNVVNSLHKAAQINISVKKTNFFKY